MLIALPLLAELPGVAWVAITEADIDNYAGMYLQHNGRDARSLFSKLAPAVDEPGIAVYRRHAGALAVARDHDRRAARAAWSNRTIVINLNPPSAIADTSWIKPGKTAGTGGRAATPRASAFRPA